MKGRTSRPPAARRTEQRQVLERILEEADRPLGVQELHAAARTDLPALSVATVYRNLRNWVESGWLVAVPVPGEADRYEVAGKAHHHHFRCEACGRVFEVFGKLPGGEALVPEGFRLRKMNIYLYGECAECCAAESAAVRRRS